MGESGKIIPYYGFTLRDAFAPRCHLIGTCWGCRKKQEIDAMDLIARLGPNTRLSVVEGRLKCRNCGSRFVAIRAEWL